MLFVVEACASHPQGLRTLLVMLSHRFPDWRRLPLLGQRDGELKQYRLVDVVRLYVGTFLPALRDAPPLQLEVSDGSQRVVACAP